MKASFDDFISQHRNCVKFKDNRDAKILFDILNDDENIKQAIKGSTEELKIPALVASVKAIEAKFDSMLNPTIDLNDNFTKRAIGRMVKTILDSFGYVVGGRRAIRKSYKSKYFKSATYYLKK